MSRTGLLTFFVTLISTGKNSDAEIVHVSPTEVKISYFLTRSQQEALSEQGISGQFVVQYDIQREKDSGEVLVIDFTHMIINE